MFGRGRNMRRPYGYGYGYQGPDVVDAVLAVEAQEEVFEDLAEGDIGAAMMDQAAANEFASGDTLGGMIDEAVADFF